MVTAESRTSRPVMGWDQVFSARESMAVLSAPRAGGELKSVPTTAKRKRAHKAAVELRAVWVITSPNRSGEGTAMTVIQRPTAVLDEHLRRAAGEHHET